MLQALVRFAIRFRGVVIALASLVLVYGIYATFHAKLDVFPEFAPPLVVIQTEAPSLSSEEVEQLVTRPIEQALNGVTDLETLRSQSIQGLSVITVIFRETAEIYRVRQLVNERLNEVARALPATVHPPVMAPLTTATSLILVAGLTSKERSLQELRTLADYELKPKLLAVPGVAKVVVFGGDVREFHVHLDRTRLGRYGIGIEEAVEAVARGTGVRGAGVVDTPNQRLVVRTHGQAVTPEALANTVVRRSQGLTVRLADLGTVKEGVSPKVGDAQIMGHLGVQLQVSGQYGANTLDVTKSIEQVLRELTPGLQHQGITLWAELFRPASFIEVAIGHVSASLYVGGALVCVVLFLFLWNVRTSLISVTAIPLSLLLAVIVLRRLGMTLNTMTLGGLAIAIGEVVDDAIIDVENIHRRLKENATRAEPATPLSIILSASLEVRSAVVYATLVVLVMFLPVIMLGGLHGRIFAPLGMAYILSIVASLVVALTLTPALCAVLLKTHGLNHEEPKWVHGLKRVYQHGLRWLLVHPKTIVGTVGVFCLGVFATIPMFEGSFLPEFREGQFIIHMSAIPGTSLAESLRIGQRVTQALLALPEVKFVSQAVGRAEKADDTWGPHYSELQVVLKPLDEEAAEAVQSKIRQTLARFPGLSFSVKPFLTERMEETISGATAQIVIKVFGENLDLLDQQAKDVAQLLSQIPGAVEIQVEAHPSVPELDIVLRRDRLTEEGLQPAVVLDTIHTATQGAVVAQVYEGSRVVEVRVLMEEATAQNPDGLAHLLLRNADGAWIPLEKVAHLRPRVGRYMIVHEGGRRRQTVTCNVAGRDLSSFLKDLRQRLSTVIKLPSGTSIELGGIGEANSQAQQDLLLQSLIAAAGIILLLWVVFRDPRNLLLVLANFPFALAGGVLAVFFTGGWVTLGSLVGFVTLFGITTRNSIMLISHYDHLVTVEGIPWGIDTALRGATERLVPILMTALVTALGLLPIALGSGASGREIEGPMAQVILGGLVTSTALNLLVLPVLAQRFGRFRVREGLG